MKSLSRAVGYLLIGFSIITGLIAYFVPAGIFFNEGDALLGFIELFFPPAAIVLPWTISPQLGLIALASIILFPLGAFLASMNEE